MELFWLALDVALAVVPCVVVAGLLFALCRPTDSLRMLKYAVFGGFFGFAICWLGSAFYIRHPGATVSNIGGGFLMVVLPVFAAVIGFDLGGLFGTFGWDGWCDLLLRLRRRCSRKARTPAKARKASAPPPGVGWF